MKLSTYVKDKAIPLLLFAGAIAMIAVILVIFKLHWSAVLAVCGLFTLTAIAALFWDYLKRRRFYEALDKALEENDQSYYLTELIDRPAFVEGQLFYDAIEQASKDMNDRIAEYRLASDEYREYVETWIHEVKTPIAATRLIIANNDDAILRAVDGELDRIEGYVEQALYYSRSTSVEKDYLIREIDLDSLVKGVVKKHSRVMIEQGISPRFEGLDRKVYADSKWLDFVLGQIVANAIKYHRPHTEGFTPEIAFTARCDEASFEGEKITLSISDNGIGIPAFDTGRVFEKGFTGENGRRYAKSTGIGLYLCKELCDKMKLRIFLTSVTEEGTTVSIEFPLNKMYFLD